MQASPALAYLGYRHPPAETTPIPVDMLLRRVYEASPPSVKTRMLSVLMGHAYDACPTPLRRMLLEQLAGALGMLDLSGIARGAFDGLHRRPSGSPPALQAAGLETIQTTDVIALVEQVQRRSMQALVSLVQSLSTQPALACSGAVDVLAGILLRRPAPRADANSGGVSAPAARPSPPVR